MVLAGWWGEGPQGLETSRNSRIVADSLGHPQIGQGRSREGITDKRNRSVWLQEAGQAPPPNPGSSLGHDGSHHPWLLADPLECSLPASSRCAGSAPSRGRVHSVQRQPHPQGGCGGYGSALLQGTLLVLVWGLAPVPSGNARETSAVFSEVWVWGEM